MSHAQTKLQKLLAAKRYYLLSPRGVTDLELAFELKIDRTSVYRYRKELGAVEVSPGRYTLVPTQEDIDLALLVLQRRLT